MSKTVCVLTLTALSQGGGAESIARNLARALEKKGLPSHVRSRAVGPDEKDPLFSRTPFDYEWRKLWRRIRYLPATLLTELGVEQFTSKEAPYLFENLPFEPDIIHCHNIRDKLLRIEDIPNLCRKAPVVWTLHDMWIATGHCAYSLDCKRWRKGCGYCPYLDLYFPIRFDFSRLNRWRRAKVFQKIAREFSGRMVLVSPSVWLRNIIRDSIAGMLPIELIPYGINLNTFKPLAPDQRAEARRKRGIPDVACVVLYAANKGKTNPFKDYETFAKAAKALKKTQTRLFFLTIGNELGTPPDPIADLELERINNPAEMAELYGITDVFVHATRADNQPLAIMEAMACETAVVGSRVGGVPEMIEEGTSGLLVEPGNANALAEAIAALAENPAQRKEFAACAAEAARKRYDETRMVEDYIRLYSRLLHNQPLA